MMDQKLVEEVNQLHAQLCQGLADPTRILILYALAGAPHHVTELANALGIRQPTISRHLKILRERGLVVAARKGNAIRYELRDRRVIDVLDTLRAMMTDLLTEQADLVEAITE